MAVQIKDKALVDFFGKLIEHSPLDAIGDELNALQKIKDTASGLRQFLSDKSEVICKVREIDLCNRGLTAIPEEIGFFTGLVQLGLTANRLTTIPPSIGKLKNLKVFHVDQNEIEELPDEMGDLESLESFVICENKLLKSLPESMGNCRELRTLNIKLCGTCAIPESFSKIPRLFSINVYETRGSVPASLMGKCIRDAWG